MLVAVCLACKGVSKATIAWLYFLRPKKSVVLGFRVTTLTQFVENVCNIYISK